MRRFYLQTNSYPDDPPVTGTSAASSTTVRVLFKHPTKEPRGHSNRLESSSGQKNNARAKTGLQE